MFKVIGKRTSLKLEIWMVTSKKEALCWIYYLSEENIGREKRRKSHAFLKYTVRKVRREFVIIFMYPSLYFSLIPSFESVIHQMQRIYEGMSYVHNMIYFYLLGLDTDPKFRNN